LNKFDLLDLNDLDDVDEVGEDDSEEADEEEEQDKLFIKQNPPRVRRALFYGSRLLTL